MGDDLGFIGIQWDLVSSSGAGVVAVLGGDEALDTCLHGGVKHALVDCVGSSRYNRDDGILTCEGFDELVDWIVVIDLVNVDVWGECRLGAFTGEHRQIESVLLVESSENLSAKKASSLPFARVSTQLKWKQPWKVRLKTCPHHHEQS